MIKKVITMCAFSRPDYTKKVIDGLKNCIGFDEYLLLPRIEPGYPKVENCFKGLSNCEVTINDSIPGCSINTFKALDKGFELSDFVIHIEDDTVPGIDCLRYFEYINRKYKNDKQIFTASAYNRIKYKDGITPENYFAITRCPSFTGWIWATWIDRWKEMKDNWAFTDPPGWDHNLNRHLRGNRFEICPLLPRSQNIGEHGLHTNIYIWKKCMRSDIWINNVLGIKDILSSKLLPSNLSADIDSLVYFENSSSIGCPTECYVDVAAIAGIIGIGLGSLYLLTRNKK